MIFANLSCWNGKSEKKTLIMVNAVYVYMTVVGCFGFLVLAMLPPGIVGMAVELFSVVVVISTLEVFPLMNWLSIFMNVTGQYPYGSNYLSGYNQLSSENQARLYQAQLQQQNWLFQQQLNQQGNQQAYLQQQAAALMNGQSGVTGQYRYPLLSSSAVYTPYSGVLPSNNVVPNGYNQYQSSSLGNLGIGAGTSGLYGNTGMVDV